MASDESSSTQSSSTGASSTGGEPKAKSSSKSSRSSRSTAAAVAVWQKYDIKTAPRNSEVLVANNKNGNRSVVIIRGEDGPCHHRGRLSWEPTHILIPPNLPK